MSTHQEDAQPMFYNHPKAAWLRERVREVLWNIDKSITSIHEMMREKTACSPLTQAWARLEEAEEILSTLVFVEVPEATREPIRENARNGQVVPGPEGGER